MPTLIVARLEVLPNGSLGLDLPDYELTQEFETTPEGIILAKALVRDDITSNGQLDPAKIRALYPGTRWDRDVIP